jgi:golgi-specific brefeldin A-resistance guanine nucleotide exchange factor 1
VFCFFAIELFLVNVFSEQILRQRKVMKQKIKSVVEVFNEKPLKQEWLKVAIDARLLAMKDGEVSTDGDLYLKVEPRAIAIFLKTIPGLGKAQIGEYISKGPADLYPFHARVLQEYVRTFDFSGTQSVVCSYRIVFIFKINKIAVNGAFDKSLRLFLSAFRLPGEAQCIDRLGFQCCVPYFLILTPFMS